MTGASVYVRAWMDGCGRYLLYVRAAGPEGAFLVDRGGSVLQLAGAEALVQVGSSRRQPDTTSPCCCLTRLPASRV